MTEAEWLGCEDPHRMLYFLQGKSTERKFQLFAVGCVRRLWGRLTERDRLAVAAVERLADDPVQIGEASQQFAARLPADPAPGLPELFAAQAVWWLGVGLGTDDPADYAPEILLPAAEAETAAGPFPGPPTRSYANDSQCRLICDIFGNPFRPWPSVQVAWLHWNGGTVRHLAEDIYEQRRFSDLPILADALEDAGCADAALLGHLREPDPHVR